MGEYRPRTAGERSGTADGQDGVRDWQKNTWFGPAPQNANPFDEPEDAPELKEYRSENVNERVGDFWAPHRPAGEYSPNTARAGRMKGAPAEQKAASRRISGRMIALLVIVVLAAAGLILRFAVFTVREIRVIGNNQIPAAEIIRISGIHQGDNILTINESDVEKRITSDYRLMFRYMGRQMPDQVVLSVREREACCWLTYCGILYVMDKNRMVLFETEDPAFKPADLVEVKGLDIRSDTLVGQTVNLGNETQQMIFGELFLEMKVLGCTADILEADVSNPDSILLATRDGYTAGLGDKENIHAKLRSLFLVRDELRKLGKYGGTINVANPETPIYSP